MYGYNRQRRPLNRYRLVVVPVILPLLAWADVARAVFRIWEPAGFSFDWHDPDNWNPPGVPTTNDNAQVSNAGISPILSADTQRVNSLVITAGAMQTNNHRLFVDNNGHGMLTINGLDVRSAKLNVFPLTDIPEFEPFALRVDRAQVLKGGSLVFNQDGIIAVVDVDLQIGARGTLRTSGAGSTTVEFRRYPTCVPSCQIIPVFLHEGTIIVGQGTTLHLDLREARFKILCLGETASSRVEIQVDAHLILDGFRFGGLNEGAVEVASGGALELRNHDLNFLSSGSINLDGGRLSGEGFTNGEAGLIAGEGTITIDELRNGGQVSGDHSITAVTLVNQGQITGRHAITTQMLNNLSGTISAVGGTIVLNADTVVVNAAGVSPPEPGIVNAVDGDVEFVNVTDGSVTSFFPANGDAIGSEVHVATGRVFRLTDSHLTFGEATTAFFDAGGTIDAANSQLTFESGSAVRFADGGTLIGGGTFGAMLGRALVLDAGSSIQVDCCQEARLENASTFDNVRLGGDVVLNDDLRLVRTIVVDNTATFTGNGSLIVDPTGSIIVQSGTEVGTDVINAGRINIEPNLGTGQIHVAAKYTQTAAGTLDVHLNNDVANQFDAMTVDGNAILDGTLNVALTPEFDAVVGNTFTIITSTFGLISGEFAHEALPEFGGLTIEVKYQPQSVVLEVVEAIHPPDLDIDGDVDGDDLALFVACMTGPSASFDPQNPPDGCTLEADAEGLIRADFDRDGHVDLAESRVIQRCFSGSGNPPTADCAD